MMVMVVVVDVGMMSLNGWRASPSFNLFSAHNCFRVINVHCDVLSSGNVASNDRTNPLTITSKMLFKCDTNEIIIVIVVGLRQDSFEAEEI